MTAETVFILIVIGLVCQFSYLAGKITEGRKASERYDELLDKYVAAQRQIKF